jgi:nitroreductase
LKTNEVLRTIHALRTIREDNFSDKEISSEDLQLVLKASVRAANASARQSYSIIIVDDAIKKKLSWPGNKVLLFCVDFTRLVDIARYLQLEFDAEYMMQSFTGVIDTSLAAQTAVIAAKSLGIDSLITNRVYQTDLKKTYELLDLPEKGCFPLVAVCLGYPAREPAHRKGRLGGPGVIHHGRYHRLTREEMAQLVFQYDNPKNHLALVDDWHEQGFQHYLEWFYAKWSKEVGTRENAKEFNEVLRKQVREWHHENFK